MPQDAADRANDEVRLRDVEVGDLPIFFEHQRDPEANRMAAFPSRTREEFDAHWAKILGAGDAVIKTIVARGRPVGHVLCFAQDGKQLVGYWIGREHWGAGYASRGLRVFLEEFPMRPLHAFVARHNAGSIRVLEKCGFTCTAEAGPSPMGGGDGVEEYVYTLAG